MTSAWLRRALVTPLMLLLECAGIVISPVLLFLAALASLLVADRRMRLPRAVILGTVYLALDLGAFAACAAAILSRRGAAERRERGFQVARWLLHSLYRAAGAILDLSATAEGDVGVLASGPGARPLVILSRHAGPGDAFLIVHELLCRGRRTAVVLRAALQADPGIDALGNLLSFCFVRRGHGHSDATFARITRLVERTAGNGAVLLFPEGGNVTEKRVRRGIRILLREGMLRRARQAARLHNLAAPIPGGALAALRGAAAADVLFIAHTGLAGMRGPVWRWVPVRVRLRMHLFHVRCEDIPDGDAARTQWLFDWWQRLDAWIDGACASVGEGHAEQLGPGGLR